MVNFVCGMFAGISIICLGTTIYLAGADQLNTDLGVIASIAFIGCAFLSASIWKMFNE